MRLIAHRGNLHGPDIQSENDPDYIDEAIGLGYDVEVDLWLFDNELFLGHDLWQYEINGKWLVDRMDKLWIHCKNVDALDRCLKLGLHCFSHDTDEATLTSKGYIWAYPGSEIYSQRCVIVLPEVQEKYLDFEVPSTFFGMCSDYVETIEVVK